MRSDSLNKSSLYGSTGLCGYRIYIDLSDEVKLNTEIKTDTLKYFYK